MLILPQSVGFADCTDTFGTGATPPAPASAGVNFTVGANNADGAAVTLLSALAHDAQLLIVGFHSISFAGSNHDCLADILIDPAGGTSWASLIDDLICGGTPAGSSDIGIGTWYAFPVCIPSGASLGVRARTNHTADLTTPRIVAYALGSPKRPDQWWCGQKVESLGITAGSSAGTNVTPGASNTYGSWTAIGTSTRQYGAIQFGINNSDATSAAANMFWQIGAGSNKLPGSPTIYMSYGTSERGCRVGFGVPIWCDIPESTSVQVRSASSVASPETTFDVGVYGVY